MSRRLLDRLIREVDLPDDPNARTQKLLTTEWLVTNGFGGYSSSTIGGVITRRYHGLLVAALPNPVGRVVMLNHLGECLVIGEESASLNMEMGVAGALDPQAASLVSAVRLERGLPVWDFKWNGTHIEKRILMPYRQNTVHVTYRLVEGAPDAILRLIPAVHFRGYEDRVDTADPHVGYAGQASVSMPVLESSRYSFQFRSTGSCARQ